MQIRFTNKEANSSWLDLSQRTQLEAPFSPPDCLSFILPLAALVNKNRQVNLQIGKTYKLGRFGDTHGQQTSYAKFISDSSASGNVSKKV